MTAEQAAVHGVDTWGHKESDTLHEKEEKPSESFMKQ